MFLNNIKLFLQIGACDIWSSFAFAGVVKGVRTFVLDLYGEWEHVQQMIDRFVILFA